MGVVEASSLIIRPIHEGEPRFPSLGPRSAAIFPARGLPSTCSHPRPAKCVYLSHPSSYVIPTIVFLACYTLSCFIYLFFGGELFVYIVGVIIWQFALTLVTPYVMYYPPSFSLANELYLNTLLFFILFAHII